MSIGSSGNQGNTSPTDKGKDKIMVYNSETESEDGDPRYRIGSRFSSYHNGSNQTSKYKEETQANIKEDIPKEYVREFDNLYRQPIEPESKPVEEGKHDLDIP